MLNPTVISHQHCFAAIRIIFDQINIFRFCIVLIYFLIIIIITLAQSNRVLVSMFLVCGYIQFVWLPNMSFNMAVVKIVI